jgi:DNA-binding MarR family transcriptional regulator
MDNLTMGELSKSIAAPMSSTTRMVNWLVENGYAVRLSDPDDRRIVRVTLTEEGRKLHEYIEGHIIKRVRETIQLLTQEEQATIINVFDKLARAFNISGARK